MLSVSREEEAIAESWRLQLVAYKMEGRMYLPYGGFDLCVRQREMGRGRCMAPAERCERRQVTLRDVPWGLTCPRKQEILIVFREEEARAESWRLQLVAYKMEG